MLTFWGWIDSFRARRLERAMELAWPYRVMVVFSTPSDSTERRGFVEQRHMSSTGLVTLQIRENAQGSISYTVPAEFARTVSVG